MQKTKVRGKDQKPRKCTKRGSKPDARVTRSLRFAQTTITHINTYKSGSEGKTIDKFAAFYHLHHRKGVEL